jgi:hypothetical protein
MLISILFINILLFTYFITNFENIFNFNNNLYFDNYNFNSSVFNNLGSFPIFSTNITQNFTLEDLIANDFYFNTNEIL